MAVIGYGVQGRAQSQNMRDNGVCYSAMGGFDPCSHDFAVYFGL